MARLEARLRMVGLALVACGAVGCELSNTLPAEPVGGRVSGSVRYAGSEHTRLDDPRLVVAVFYSFPPGGPPYGSVTIAGPALSAGPVPFEIPYLPEGQFYVVANLVDGNESFAPAGPIGSFPDACELNEPQGNIEVTAAAPTVGLDIELFDNGGAGDPCAQPALPCPDPGRAALTLEATSSVMPAGIAAADQIIYGLFTVWPPAGPPASSRIIPSEEIAFPLTVIDTAIVPGDYVVYVCLDRGGDNLMTTCGGVDLWAIVPGSGAQSFVSGEVSRFEFDLDAGTAQLVSVDPPSAYGCP